MKKVILSLVVVAALSASCKKNYTCTCTINGANTSTTWKTSKSTATTDCDNLDTSAKSVGGSCTLN